MRYTNLLPLAVLSSAFVVPNEQILSELGNQADAFQKDVSDTASNAFEKSKDFYHHTVDEVEESASYFQSKAINAIDQALGFSEDAGRSMTDAAFDAESWISNKVEHSWEDITAFEDHDHPPHHGPPHHRPAHPPQHGKPNQTVWELIDSSKYTTKLAELIKDYPDMVDALNGTEANFTFFAPIDSAFDKIPEHAPKPSKEELLAVLKYHITPAFYPAGRVLVSHTLPTLLKADHLTAGPKPQRISINLGFKGLTVNFYSRIVAIDIFGTNGVIHGIDSFLVPPPNVISIIDFLPSEFSTLELGLGKTGLLDTLNTTDHNGGTFFAPSNFAFQKLGPRINAFLFSTYGRKYLKALLEYHVVPDITLYSDEVYEKKDKDDDEDRFMSLFNDHDHDDDDHKHHGGPPHHVPKGYYHYTLPTMLSYKTDKPLVLNADIARYGRFIGFKLNGFSRVVVQDGIAQDGVIQVVSDVLIPPKNAFKPPMAQEKKGWFGKVIDAVKGEEEMTVDEFKGRFEGLVDEE